ncbi:MAG: Iron-sulfur flavoprotein [Firmicutes bacterium ADurb.Bin193]|nr:MAG: Iron-sulfur flavoprotein [Firmicutes bacterium ADurb.Bin193]
MKITVIYGNTRRGSTWHCADLIVRELSRHTKTEVTEFYLPKDMPHFCCGCFSCFYSGEHTCPHYQSVHPIAGALLRADLIILTSPVYAMNISGALKAMLDHLCYMWLSHRPDPRMFDKIALTVSTTAGAGLKSATETMRNSLKFWGVKRIFSYTGISSASEWDEVSPEKLEKIKKQTAAVAKRIAKAAENIGKLRPPLFRTVFFAMMAGMMKKNTWNPYDKKHWVDNRWLKDGV